MNSSLSTFVMSDSLWFSPLACLIYFLVALLVVYLLVRSRLARLRRESQELLEQQIEQLRMEHEADKFRYIMSLTREFQGSLSQIEPSIAALRGNIVCDQQLLSVVEPVAQELARLSHLVDMVHSIKLNDMGMLSPKLSVMECGEFITTILDRFKQRASYEHKSLMVNHPRTECFIYGDRAMLEMVINNLINNSLKYSTAGAEITLSWRVEEGELHIELRDTGVGISMEDLPHIFELFYRGAADDDDRPAGSGISLAITKQLVELHGGEIYVESAVAQGSSFKLVLPIVASQEQIAEYRGESEQASKGAPSLPDSEADSQFSGSMIYLVEESATLRGVLEHIVGQRFQLRSFPSGGECLAAMEHDWPDVVVCDVMINGDDEDFELCRAVKANLATSHIPVIILAESSSEQDHIRALGAGADQFIVKPLRPAYLVACIEMLLSSREALRGRYSMAIPTSNVTSLSSRDDEEFLGKLYELLSQSFSDDNIDINHYARELGVNRSLFFRRVKLLTERTPFELLKDYRLTRAAEMLDRREHSVEEVYTHVGFKSRTHFSRLFKEKFEVTPGKYAESVLTEKINGEI